MSKLNGGSLIPAYGRDYKSAKSAIESFNQGLDFLLVATPSGPTPRDLPVNIEEFAPGARVQIRYGKLSKVTVHKVPSPNAR